MSTRQMRVLFGALWVAVACMASIMGEEDWLSHWYSDQYAEIVDTPKELVVEGVLPDYLLGTLMRMGPTQLRTEGNGETGAKNYTNFLDGYGRVTSWALDGSTNSASILSTYIRGAQYNASMADATTSVPTVIPRHIMQQQTAPRTGPGFFAVDQMDNTDVNVYRFKVSITLPPSSPQPTHKCPRP